MPHYPNEIEHGSKYYDDLYEYKTVYLPKEVMAHVPLDTYLSEIQCKYVGIIHSNGWEHYLIFKNEPNAIHFRRPIGTDTLTGKVPDSVIKKIEEHKKKREAERNEYMKYINENYDNERLTPFSFVKK